MTNRQLDEYFAKRQIAQGSTLHLIIRNKPYCIKITSIKRWKKEPARFYIHFKYGLRTHGVIDNFSELHTCWLSSSELNSYNHKHL